MSSKRKKEKSKKRKAIFEQMILQMLAQSMKEAINIALDEVEKSFK